MSHFGAGRLTRLKNYFKGLTFLVFVIVANK